MNKKLLSVIYVLIAGALWGTIGTFFTFLSSYGFSRIEVVFIRSATACLALLVFILIKNPLLLKISPRDLWMFIGTGIVSLLMFNYCYFTAIELTTLSVAAVLLYTAPVFVMLLSAVFFKERFTVNKVLALILTIPGCAIVSGLFSGQQVYSTAGILFGLGSGIGYALYTIFSRFALSKYDSMTISFYTFLFSSLGSSFLCSPLRVGTLMASSAPTILWAVGIGLATCLIPYLFYTKGLTGISNSEASITATIEPVVAAIISVVFFKEAMSADKLCGIIFILGAVVILNLSFTRKRTMV